MWPIYNFKVHLEPHINKVNKQLIRITKCQQFKINYEGKFLIIDILIIQGIRTKLGSDHLWSVWRGKTYKIIFLTFRG